MPNMVDLPRTAQLWTAQERDLYNRLPIYMTKVQVDFFKQFNKWAKLLKGVAWSPNMGFTMRGVHKEFSPILRSEAYPNPITSQPKKDVIEVREAKEEVQLYRQHIESNLFHFLPSFVDFLTDSIDKTTEDITQKMAVYSDQFYRTSIFQGSPAVWICGKASGTELTATPYWTSPTISKAKTAAEMQSMVAACTDTITLPTLHKIGQVMANDIGATFFSGDVMADGTDGAAFKGKMAFLSGMEVWQNFAFDQYLLGNRPLSMDVVTQGFTGSLFGMWTSSVERFELRVKADGTFPAPEIVEENSSAYDFGERKMNPDYVNATHAIAFGIGGEAYKSIKVGPPPRDFQGMSMKEFANLDWNGKVSITQNVMVPALDQNNAQILDTNKRGEYLQMLSDMVLGILPVRRRNIVPILYKRNRGTN